MRANSILPAGESRAYILLLSSARLWGPDDRSDAPNAVSAARRVIPHIEGEP
jgi:hypothetical protein